MAKKKAENVVESDSRDTLVDGKDQKRIEELQGRLVELQAAFKANQETVGFILKDYAKKDEQIAGYNKDNGMITLKKKPKEA